MNGKLHHKIGITLQLGHRLPELLEKYTWADFLQSMIDENTD